jgi:hypothetical protein
LTSSVSQEPITREPSISLPSQPCRSPHPAQADRHTSGRPPREAALRIRRASASIIPADIADRRGTAPRLRRVSDDDVPTSCCLVGGAPRVGSAVVELPAGMASLNQAVALGMVPAAEQIRQPDESVPDFQFDPIALTRANDLARLGELTRSARDRRADPGQLPLVAQTYEDSAAQRPRTRRVRWHSARPSRPREVGRHRARGGD